jgi:hypothetical protein
VSQSYYLSVVIIFIQKTSALPISEYATSCRRCYCYLLNPLLLQKTVLLQVEIPVALELLVPRDRSPRLKLDLLDKATVPVSSVLFRPQLEVLLFVLFLHLLVAVIVTHRLVARHPDLMLAVVSYPTSCLFFSLFLYLSISKPLRQRILSSRSGFLQSWVQQCQQPPEPVQW